MNMIKLQVLENIETEKMREIYSKSELPIIFRNTRHKSSEAKNWNLEKLSKKWGDIKIPIQIFPIAQNLQPHYKTDRNFKIMSLKNYIEIMEQDEQSHGHSSILGKIPLSKFPEIKKEVSFPKLFKRKALNSVLWLYKKKSTALHYDIVETLLYQVKGKKRIVLAPPSTEGMYLFPLLSKTPHFSPVDLENKDLDKFPKLKDVQVYEAIIEEGDVLYIPYCWWHQVYGEGEVNISIASWYLCSPLKVLKNLNQTIRLWGLHLYRFLVRYPV